MRYRVVGEIGQGALGRVVRLEDEAGGVFAGKLLHASSASDARARERFAREAALLRTIAHPNVVRVHERTEIDGQGVLVMELADGPTLAELIAHEAPMPEARVRELARGIALGLGAAHRAGVVHRDLKPANVIVVGGVPKLVDFGLAQATSMLGVDRTSFALVGTPDYLAPESVDPLAVDARADLYALGCVLFEMLAGRPPYGGATPLAILDAHRRAPIPAVTAPDALRALVTALLAKSPVDRPPSADAVVEALDASAALVLAGATATRCHQCGWALVDGAPGCFGCGVALPRLEPGGATVFVVGPGAIGDRLDDELRGALVTFLRATPSLGLDPAPLAKKAFRVPFVLARGVSLEGAQTLAKALRGLGLEVDARAGGTFAVPGMGAKARTMGGRIALIVFGSTMAGWAQLATRTAWAIMLVPAAFGMIGYGVYGETRKAATGRLATTAAAGPRLLGPALDASFDTAGRIQGSRHRDTLRGVAARAVALRAAVGDGSLDGELAEVLALATRAAERLDGLETTLAARDLREPDAETREAVHTRDRLTAHILQLTGRLDALRVRVASAQVRKGSTDARDTLDDLRAEIAGLGEVAKL